MAKKAPEKPQPAQKQMKKAPGKAMKSPKGAIGKKIDLVDHPKFAFNADPKSPKGKKPAKKD